MFVLCLDENLFTHLRLDHLSIRGLRWTWGEKKTLSGAKNYGKIGNNFCKILMFNNLKLRSYPAKSLVTQLVKTS